MTPRSRALLSAGAVLATGLAAGLALWPPALPKEPRFRPLDLSGLTMWIRPDHVRPGLSEAGPSEVEMLGNQAVLWLQSPREIGPVLFLVRGRVNRVVVGAGGAAKEFEPDGSTQRFFFEWHPEAARRDRSRSGFFYRLELSLPDREVQSAAAQGRVSLALVGTRAFLDRDIYRAEWLGCGAPRQISAGDEILVLAHVKNTSEHPWPHTGTAHVALTAQWLSSGGGSGTRTALDAVVEPGGEAAQWLRLRAPDEAGRQELSVDLFFEPMASFSQKGVPACSTEVEILEAP